MVAGPMLATANEKTIKEEQESNIGAVFVGTWQQFTQSLSALLY